MSFFILSGILTSLMLIDLNVYQEINKSEAKERKTKEVKEKQERETKEVKEKQEREKERKASELKAKKASDLKEEQERAAKDAIERKRQEKTEEVQIKAVEALERKRLLQEEEEEAERIRQAERKAKEETQRKKERRATEKKRQEEVAARRRLNVLREDMKKDISKDISKYVNSIDSDVYGKQKDRLNVCIGDLKTLDVSTLTFNQSDEEIQAVYYSCIRSHITEILERIKFLSEQINIKDNKSEKEFGNHLYTKTSNINTIVDTAIHNMKFEIANNGDINTRGHVNYEILHILKQLDMILDLCNGITKRQQYASIARHGPINWRLETEALKNI